MPVGSNVDQGDHLTITALSAGSLNADLVPSTDVSQYKWLNLYIGPDTYAGTLTFQGSFDNTNWFSVTLYAMQDLQGPSSVSSITNLSLVIYSGPVRFTYFRCRMTSYASGGATGILDLRKDSPGLQLVGNWSTLLANKFIIGATSNDGSFNQAIAAGVTSNTQLHTGKCMLSSVLVTTAGSAQMNFYDTGTGIIVGLIPITATVNGVPYVFKAFCANGITADGASGNPGVTVFYTDIYG